MKLWKFIIPSDDPREDSAGRVWFGIGAAIVAETEQQARECLRTYAALHAEGHAGWIEVATVTAVEIERGAVALWVEV